MNERFLCINSLFALTCCKFTYIFFENSVQGQKSIYQGGLSHPAVRLQEHGPGQEKINDLVYFHTHEWRKSFFRISPLNHRYSKLLSGSHFDQAKMRRISEVNSASTSFSLLYSEVKHVYMYFFI